MENEVWKDIEGYEGIYQVSSLGRVRSLDRIVICHRSSKIKLQHKKSKMLSLIPLREGYVMVSLSDANHKRSYFSLSQLVANAFVHHPAGCDKLIHLDGNFQNNRANNLKWVEQWNDNNGEIWKDIDGYEGLYQVSNMGRVRSFDRYQTAKYRNGKETTRLVKGRILIQGKHQYGYWTVCLYDNERNGTTQVVHRLVAQAFIPNPDNLPYVNHKDENPKNNNVNNLEWCTAQYNNNYGTARLRSASKRWVPVVQMSLDGKVIRKFRSIKEAAENFGVKNPLIGEVCRGKRQTYLGFRWRYDE